LGAETCTSRLEAALTAIADFPRNRLIYELTHFSGSLRLDFTEDFLAHLSDEKLRHILLAAYLHGRPNHSINTEPTPQPVAV